MLHRWVGENSSGLNVTGEADHISHGSILVIITHVITSNMLYRWVGEDSSGSVSLEELIEFLEDRLSHRAQVQSIEA